MSKFSIFSVLVITAGLMICTEAPAAPVCSLSFLQFGPPGTTISSPASGCFYGYPGIELDFSAVTTGATFTVGHYANGYTYLFDDGAAGPATLNFSVSPNQTHLFLPDGSLFGFAVKAPGAYTATATIYAGANAVASETLSSPGGPAQYLTFLLQAPNQKITSFEITSTNDSQGWYLISESTPEPVSWALMVIGFAGLGAALRGRRAREAPASLHRAG